MTTASTFNSGTAVDIQNFFQTIAQMLDVTFDLSKAPTFKLTLDNRDGHSVDVNLTPYDSGASADPVVFTGHFQNVSSFPLDADIEHGQATLVAGTVDVTVPASVGGGEAVPVGSLVYATYQTPAGHTALLSAVRHSSTQIRISSAPTGAYLTISEASVATGTLVLGTCDITLANTAGDRLIVAAGADNGGTPGVLSVKRKNNTTVTVESWLAATGIQVLDVSDVSVYNIGAPVNDTSLVRWVVVRP